MPLKSGKSNIGINIKELLSDNKKPGIKKGAGGTPRPKAQILAIAISAAKKGKK